jgi:hypothetical protein
MVHNLFLSLLFDLLVQELFIGINFSIFNQLN